MEDLTETSLPTSAQRWILGALIVVGSALSGALFFEVSGQLAWWLLSGGSVTVGIGGMGLIGMFVGTFGAISAAFAELRPVETLRLSIPTMRTRKRAAIRPALILGITVGAPLAISLGPIGGIVGGVGAALVGGALGLTLTEAIDDRDSPNRGTHRSMRKAVGIALSLALVGGVVSVLSLGPASHGTSVALGMLYGQLFGIISGLAFGGFFSLRHFVLRILLWLTRSGPLNYVRFLNYAVDRLFLRKVGGGYIFTHRMLMEYFASLHLSNKT